MAEESETTEVTADQLKQVCDKVLEHSIALMASVAPMAMIIDRIATYAVAAIVADGGKAHAIDVLAGIAHKIEQGEFDRVLPPTVQ